MPRRRKSLRWLAAALVLLAAPVFVWLAIDALVRSRLERARDAFAIEGFPTTPADVTPSPVADDGNAALLIAEIGRRLRAPDPTPLPVRATPAPADTGALFEGITPATPTVALSGRTDRISDLYVDHLGFPVSAPPPPDDVLTELRALLASKEVVELLDLAHRASTRTRYSPGIDYTAGPGFSDEHIRTLRTLARLLAARAALNLRTTRDPASLWSDILATERLARLAAEPGSLVHLLTSIACSGINHRNLVDAMSATLLPEDDEAVLAFLLAAQTGHSTRFARALSTERVIFLDWTTNWMVSGGMAKSNDREGLAAIGLFPGWIARLPHPVQNTWIRRKLAQNYEAHLGALTLLRDQPTERWISGLKGLDHSSDEDALMPLVPVYATIVMTELADQARHAATVIAFAASLYRRSTGQWPASIAGLGLPDTILIDPCSGQAIRFHTESERLLVYAFGPDGKDDGGRDWQAGPERTLLDGDIVVEITLPR